MSEMLMGALAGVLDPVSLLLVVLGVGAGIMVGALPGLTATMAIALLVPFTFGMSSIHGLALLGAIYAGAIYGGSFSAILINTPGTPSAIATTFDGFPMARKGDAYRAIVTATLSSVFGGVVGVIFLIFLSPPLARASLSFGPPEYFWLAAFGLTIIAAVSPRSTLKGLIGGGIGLLISTIGIAPIEGAVRYSFGTVALQNGISLIPALIGFFCIPEVLRMVEESHEAGTVIPYKRQRRMVTRVFRRLVRMPWLMIRSSILGTLVGIIPGAGGNIAGLVSYNEAIRTSKNKERFGEGAIEGVAASETANNASVAGALIPMLTLGVPGAPPAAVLFGALLLQGMRPGAELFTSYGTITYAFLFSLIIANLAMLPLGVILGRLVARVMQRVRVQTMAPIIIFLSMVGSYSIYNNSADIYTMVIVGLLAHALRKAGFMPGPIVLGLILGPIAEQGLTQSVLMGRARGSMFAVFFGRPISVVLILLAFLSVAAPIFVTWRERQGKGNVLKVLAEAEDAASQKNQTEEGR
ncbi:MAG: tripartite tricarboxylate transporter permease [Alkalispirochaetaceae bacterium]